jgi:hypothetical protein
MIDTARFLLDQGFPRDPIGTWRLDKRVEYVSLHQYAPEMSQNSTPDWLVYVAAAAGGFDGLVTGDKSQLQQDTELIALAQTRITLVTWTHGDEDAITRWGQLLAYMPQILKRMEPGKGAVISIPNPRLSASNRSIEHASDIARARKTHDNVSYNERRDRELAHMRPTLINRGYADWLPLLTGKAEPPHSSKR